MLVRRLRSRTALRDITWSASNGLMYEKFIKGRTSVGSFSFSSEKVGVYSCSFSRKGITRRGRPPLHGAIPSSNGWEFR